jgi:hypothetical protein
MKSSLYCPPHHLNLKTKASWSTDWRKHRLELYDPGNTDMHHRRRLPRAAVEAIGMSLLPRESSSDGDVWWQLQEADRYVFRAVYFHFVIMGAAKRGSDGTERAVVVWLRWAAVRQAHFSEEIPWPKAYAAAAARLKGTKAFMGWRMMKDDYSLVQRILKARPGQ